MRGGEGRATRSLELGRTFLKSGDPGFFPLFDTRVAQEGRLSAHDPGNSCCRGATVTLAAALTVCVCRPPPATRATREGQRRGLEARWHRANVSVLKRLP